MGCWNATCAISGLPIPREAPVRMVLLTQGRDQFEDKPPPANGTTYPDDLWRPIVWPVSGLYDEYGLIEKIRIPADKLFNLRLNSIKPPSKHDPEGDYRFFDALACGRLDRSTSFGGRFYAGDLLHCNQFGCARPLGHTFVLEEVWQGVLELGVDQWHTTSTRAMFRQEVEAYIDDASTWFRKCPKGVDEDTQDWFSKDIKRRISQETHNSGLRRAIFRESYWFDTLLREAVFKDICREDILQAGYEVADLLHLRNVMGQLRMLWTPGKSQGSQETDWGTHKAFHAMVVRIAGTELEKEENA